MPAGRSSSRVSRTASGMSANSSSIEEMPIAASISRRSSSVTDVYLDMAAAPAAEPSAAAYVLTIGGSVHQAVGLARVRQLDLHEPALAGRGLIALLGRVRERLIGLGDLARQRRDHVRDGLDRLDLGIGLVLLDLGAGGRRVEEDELAELVLGEPRDAERGGVALHACPVVLGVVKQAVWIFLVAHESLE